MIRNFSSPTLIFAFVLILLGLFLRVFLIQNIPFSYYHDEMDHVFTGEAVARFGTDITGNWSPLQLQPLKTVNYVAELPAFFYAFFQKIFGYGPENGHLPSVFFGIMTAFLSGLIVYFLTQRKDMGLITTGVILVNPWHVHISRLGYEATISIAFQVLFLFGIVISLKKNRSRLQSFLAFLFIFLGYFFAFFTYFGAKFTQIILAVAAILIIWFFYRLKNLRWTAFLTFFLCLLIIVSTLHTLGIQKQGLMGNRQTELLTLESTSSEVNTLRKTSLDFPLKNLFFNKFTLLANEIIQREFFIFNPYRLFFSGMENTYQFSLIVYGYFYLSSLIFLFLGIIHLTRKNKKTFYFLLILLVTSPVTSLITLSLQSIFRSGLTYLILLIFIGIGLASFIEYLNQKKFRFPALTGLLILLTIEALWFGYDYFSRYPVLAADNHNFNQKLLSAYLNRLSGPVTVITDLDTYSIARSFVSYSQRMGSLSAKERAQFSDPSGTYFQIGNISFFRHCQKYSELPKNPIIIDPAKMNQCAYDNLITRNNPNQDTSKFLALGSPIDSGTYFYLINDPICHNQIADFVYPIHLTQFDLFNLKSEDFCKTWVYPDNRQLIRKKTNPSSQ